MRGGPPKSVSKIGVPPGAMDRNVATAPTLSPDQGGHRTQIYTYFTKVPIGNDQATQVLYNGDRRWAKITLTLETAGPVAVGQNSVLTPVTGGAGRLLPTGREVPFIIAKGDRLHIAATSVNRIAVMVEPLPWLEQIFAMIGRLVDRVSGRPGQP